jgi:hypothetical protein
MADLSKLSDAELDALDQAADKEAANPAPSVDQGNPNNHWYDTALGVAAVPLQGGGGKALEYGLEGLGGYYGAKKLLQATGNAFRGSPAATPMPPAAPAAPAMPPPPTTPAAPPTTFTGGANPAWDKALSRPYTAPAAPPPTSPAAPPTAQNFLARMAQQFGPIAQQVAPYVRAGGVALAGMAPATLNTNEQAELARRDPNYARFLANRPRYPGQQ